MYFASVLKYAPALEALAALVQICAFTRPKLSASSGDAYRSFWWLKRRSLTVYALSATSVWPSLTCSRISVSVTCFTSRTVASDTTTSLVARPASSWKMLSPPILIVDSSAAAVPAAGVAVLRHVAKTGTYECSVTVTVFAAHG